MRRRPKPKPIKSRRVLAGQHITLERLEERRLLSITQLSSSLSVSLGVALLGDTIYFSANSTGLGIELWKTDGTSSGTQLVADINPGTASSSPTGLVNVGGVLYFRANTATSGAELWRSDGTSSGTQLVADLNPGTGSSLPKYLTNVGGTIYFVANNGTTGEELWKSDGTSSGTQLVADIRTGTNSSTPKSLTNVNGTLYFIANDGTRGNELWKSNGTSSGTQLVRELNVGTSSGALGYLAEYNGYVYFSGFDGEEYALWRSNGTSSGTSLEVEVGTSDSGLRNLANIGGILYFFASDDLPGFRLWRTDGTAAGTFTVSASAGLRAPSNLVDVSGTLYFATNDGTHGYELWRSDSTLNGTRIVTDVSSSFDPASLTNVNGTLFFAANDGSTAHGNELWFVRPTDNVAMLAADLRAGSGDSNPFSLTNLNGSLFFAAHNGSDIRPWLLSGPNISVDAGKPYFTQVGGGLTLSGRAAVALSTASPNYAWDINGDGLYGDAVGPNPSLNWSDLLALGITSSTASTQVRLRADDGLGNFADSLPVTLTIAAAPSSAAELVRILDSMPTRSSSPENMLTIGAITYFTASDGLHGIELWKTDGTPAGTSLVKDIAPGIVSSASTAPHDLTNAGGTLYFWASDVAGLPALWTSDGTESGTIRLKQFSEIGTSNSVWVLATVGNRLLFRMVGDPDLWVSDGTPEGTVAVPEAQAATTFKVVGSQVFFQAQSTGLGAELWVSDGTAAGTQFVKDIYPGTVSSTPTGFVPLGDKMLFLADSPGAGIEPWITDGTSSGTQLVADILPGTASSSAAEFTELGGKLIFAANGPSFGREIWTTDGTSSGTMLLNDLDPGSWSSSPQSFARIGDAVYFSTRMGSNSYQLGRTDGTSAGTAILLSAQSPYALNAYEAGDRIYVKADLKWYVTDGTVAGTTLLPGSIRLPYEYQSFIQPFGNRVAIVTQTSLPYPTPTSYYQYVVDDVAGVQYIEQTSAAEIQYSPDRNLNFVASGDFYYYNALTSQRAWKKIDGTTGTLQLVATINYSATSTNGVLNGDRFLFGAGLTSLGTELWAFDTTTDSVGLLREINTLPSSGTPTALGSFGGKQYFQLPNSLQGTEIWATDGTLSGTTMIARPTPSTTSFTIIAQAGGKLYLRQGATAAPYILIATDGTTAGTTVLASNSSSGGLAVLGDKVVVPLGPTADVEPWITDGTLAGTVRLADINPGSTASANPTSLTTVGNLVYFAANDGVHGTELWKTDGTSSGTVLAADLNTTPAASSSPANFVNLGGNLFFTANDGVGGVELWKSNGTPAGTLLVRDIRTGSNSSSPANLTVIGSMLYFAANNGVNGIELWASDGSSAGTFMVKDIDANTSSSSPTSLMNVGGRLYFAANTSAQGRELWTSDGTSAGTVLLKDITTGSTSSTFTSMTAVGNRLYFVANADQLWTSDGTPSGTVRMSPSNTTTITKLTPFRKSLYFSARESNSWTDLWQSDGTAAGTRWTMYSVNGGYSLSPSMLLGIDDALYFAGSLAALWKYSPPAWSNAAPLAAIGGPYAINEGQSLTLGASASDPDSDLLAYSWDINDDGDFGDAFGLAPNLTWSQLETLGIVAGHCYDVSVQVSDGFGGLATATTTLSITAIPPTAGAGGPYTIAEGQSLVLAGTGSDPGGGPLDFTWDLNGDSIFGDATGATPTLTWAQLALLNITDGLSSYLITLQVTDTVDGTSTTAATTLTVNNAAPTAGISGPASLARNASGNFTLTATDPAAADQSAGFTWTIDWYGDGSDIQVVNGLSGLVVAHTFTSVGARTIKVTATDNDGGVSSQSTHPVSISAVTTPLGGNLVWTGSAGNDQVQFEQLDATTIRVTTTLDNGVATNFVETFSNITGVVDGKGLAGDDTLDASLLTTMSAHLNGGIGNNTVYGGGAGDILVGGGSVGAKVNGPEGQQGNNVVVGGAGDDMIYGNAVNGAEGKGGSNILLGGAGNDTIYGNWTDGGEGGGRNIIVGGADADTLYDYKIADGAEGKGSILVADELDESLGLPQLQQIMAEWSSTHTYTDRVNNILGPGSGGRLNGNSYLQPGTTVTSDAAVDQLWGSAGGTAFDWFLYSLAVDEINRTKVGEMHTTV